MTRQTESVAGRAWGHWLLVFVAALLLAAPAHAAAPPPLPHPQDPALFGDPEEFHPNAPRMTMALFGASTTPTGPWSSVAVLLAGEHPRVRAWKFGGVMTNRVTRWVCGTSTAFLAGWQGGPAGLAAINELVTLKAGDYLMCWALRDTDRPARPLPRAWVNVFTDEKAIGTGGLEAEFFSKILVRANYTSTAAFTKSVRKDITFAHIFNEPDLYRGQIVRVEGRLKRINRFSVPREAADEGVNDLYEAWIFSEMLGSSPYCVTFTEWPAELPRDLLGEQIKGDYVVRFDGWFIKKFRYKASDGKSTLRDSPLLIGHSLVVIGAPRAEDPDKADRWLTWLTTGIVGVFGTLLVTILGLSLWFRRSDTAARQRIRARGPEFVLPPPDALPVAPPVAPPVKRTSFDRTPLPRIPFSPRSGDRSGEPPASGEGGKRGSGDKPPEEGAGP